MRSRGVAILVLLADLWYGGVAYAQSTNLAPVPQRPAASAIDPAHVVRILVRDYGGVSSLGSGVYYHEDDERKLGYVLTNAHVVRDRSGARVEVIFPAYRVSHQAAIVFADERFDIALLRTAKFAAKDLPNIPLAASVTIGERLTLYGYGADWRLVPQTGVHRGRFGRNGDASGTIDLVFTQARSGDSGGPIFNAKGELAGILWGASDGMTQGTAANRIIALCQAYCPGGNCYSGGLSRGYSGGGYAPVSEAPPSPPPQSQSDPRLDRMIDGYNAWVAWLQKHETSIKAGCQCQPHDTSEIEARLSKIEAQLAALAEQKPADLGPIQKQLDELAKRPQSFRVRYEESPHTQTVELGGEMVVPGLHYEVIRPGRGADRVTIPNDGANMFSLDLTSTPGKGAK